MRYLEGLVAGDEIVFKWLERLVVRLGRMLAVSEWWIKRAREVTRVTVGSTVEAVA